VNGDDDYVDGLKRMPDVTFHVRPNFKIGDKVHVVVGDQTFDAVVTKVNPDGTVMCMPTTGLRGDGGSVV
jgi:hypothetical protein